MGEDELPFGSGQHVGVGQQGEAGGPGEVLAQEEIPVAVHQMGSEAGGASLGEGGDDLLVAGIIHVVVADPGLEAVAEDVEAVVSGYIRAGDALQKGLENADRPGSPGRQVQVGDEVDQVRGFRLRRLRPFR